jgi:hypothetical protein
MRLVDFWISAEPPSISLISSMIHVVNSLVPVPWPEFLLIISVDWGGKAIMTLMNAFITTSIFISRIASAFMPSTQSNLDVYGRRNDCKPQCNSPFTHGTFLGENEKQPRARPAVVSLVAFYQKQVVKPILSFASLTSKKTLHFCISYVTTALHWRWNQTEWTELDQNTKCPCYQPMATEREFRLLMYCTFVIILASPDFPI